MTVCLALASAACFCSWYLNLPYSIRRHTGGFAVAAISTRSTSNSPAMRKASIRLTTPSGSLSGPDRRTSGAMISRFKRCLRSSRWRRSRNSVAMVIFLESRRYKKVANPAQLTSGKSAFGGNLVGDAFDERVDRHDTEVAMTPGSHCNGTCCPLLVACDQDVRQLLHRMLAYFIRDLLVAQIEQWPETEVGQ